MQLFSECNRLACGKTVQSQWFKTLLFSCLFKTSVSSLCACQLTLWSGPKYPPCVNLDWQNSLIEVSGEFDQMAQSVQVE